MIARMRRRMRTRTMRAEMKLLKLSGRMVMWKTQRKILLMGMVDSTAEREGGKMRSVDKERRRMISQRSLENANERGMKSKRVGTYYCAKWMCCGMPLQNSKRTPAHIATCRRYLTDPQPTF